MTTTAAMINRHAADLHRRNLRPSTIYQRRRVLARLIGQLPDRPLLELTSDEITAALDARRIAPSTRACEIAHLAKFYEWAQHQHGVESPMSTVIRPRLPERLPRPMPDVDVQRAIENAPNRIHPILMLATYAGLRACEIAQVRAENALIDASTPVLVIPEGKGGSPSTIRLHPELVEMFARLPRTGLVNPRGDDMGGPCAAWRISQVANAYLHSIGIGHTLHTLRHWFGTNVYRTSGRDLVATQKALRHRDIKSTLLYTWVDPGEVGEAVVALPVVGRRTRGRTYGGKVA